MPFWWRWLPALTRSLFLIPVAAGLVATVLPAFGILPALGGVRLSLAPWQTLLEQPGLATSTLLSMGIGLSATLLSLFAAAGAMAALSGRLSQGLNALLSPILATPHAAMAIGFAFLIAPSGWLARLISPWLTGWSNPPDIATVGHASGIAVIAGLLLKEVPYLMLMIASALQQIPVARQMRVARSLGYHGATAWFKVILPQVYPQIRLPIFAVLAYSLSVVDVSLVLGPGTPPPLSVLALRWLTDPDLRFQFPGAAAALLLVLMVAGSIALWLLIERISARYVLNWCASGVRTGWVPYLANAGAGLALLLALASLASLTAMALWSWAWSWRFPAALPDVFSAGNWQRQAATAMSLAASSLFIALTSTVIALALTLASLEAQDRYERGPGRTGWWLYVPLLIPQIAFLFGTQVLMIRVGIDGTWSAVIWAHLLFVLPYVYLSLVDPWGALDKRLATTAASLGATPARIFWQIKIPMLARPLLTAAAVGFAVSFGQYLSTLFAGNGRIATLATEAVTLASGADRRTVGVFAFLQAALPFLAYAAALVLPALWFRNRRGMWIRE